MSMTDDIAPIYGKLRTEIMIPNHVTPSLNDSLGQNWKQRNQHRKRYEKIIWALTRNQHKGPVRLEIYRHSSGTLDEDNLYGGCKQLVDALKNRKVIIDDTPAIIRERKYEQVKISRVATKMMVIVITDL
jgi:hypothetical protein